MIPYGDERRPAVFAAVVWSIVAVNAYFFYLELIAIQPAKFIDTFAMVPYNITHHVALPSPSPQPYWLTLLSSMFLHGSFLHIFFNMLFLVVFGPRMERYFGHAGFAIIYLLCGVAGSVAQIAAAPSSHVPEIGASGAIAGILGSYIVTYPASRIDTVTLIGCFPLFLRLPAIIVIGIWAALQFVYGFGTVDPRANSSSVAYFAHIGGFSCGAIAGILSLLAGRNRR